MAKNIQSFLLKKMKQEELNGLQLSKKLGISRTLTNLLINGKKPNPSLRTVLKIANTFNKPIDLILSNSNTSNSAINSQISEKEAMVSLKNYILQHTSNPKNLATAIGVGMDTIDYFINENHPKKTLGTHIITKLANHWDVSIDEMIGRAVPAKDKASEVEAKPEQNIKTPEPSKQAKSTSPIVEKILKQKQEIQSPSRQSHAERILEERSKSKDQKRER